MDEQQTIEAGGIKKSLVGYIAGFVLSLLLTIEAYLMVTQHLLTGQYLQYMLMGLALVQLVIQLVFFLHIAQGKETRWNLTFLLSTVGIILIMVVGSLWIMDNLNQRMMSPAELLQYVQDK